MTANFVGSAMGNKTPPKKKPETKEDPKQRFPNNEDGTTLREEIEFAKEGNRETLRVIKDNVGDIEKVLELKKDYSKTLAYIRALEDSQKNEFQTTPPCYIPPKSQEGEWLGKGWFKSRTERNVALGVAVAILLIKIKDYGAMGIAIWLAGGATIVATLCVVALPLWGLQKVASSKKVRRGIYEDSKRWVEIVRANGMVIPAPGTKKTYYKTLDLIERYERDFPEEIEHRQWLDPETKAMLEKQARAR
jgi:hypothetical protein